MKRKLVLLIVAWTAGVAGGCLLLFMVLLKRIKIKGYQWKKFVPKKGLIVISNHPSLVEPGVLPFLFFPWYLVFSRFAPISTPDKENYYNKYWFFFLRPVCIPIERNGSRKALAVLEKMEKIVREKRILILFPEAGRTFKGEKFAILNSRRVKKFPAGISRLFQNLDCQILPVWVEGMERILPNKWDFSKQWPFFRFWRKAEITIGETFDSKTLPQNRKKINDFLENILLRV